MQAEAPGRVQDVRRQNLAVALAAIQRAERSTRAEIAARTGLTKASVSSLVAGLLETGLVEEVGVTRDGERGRPGSGLVLNRQRGALGAEVNVDYLAAARQLGAVSSISKPFDLDDLLAAVRDALGS